MSTFAPRVLGKPWWQSPGGMRHPAIRGFSGKGEYGGVCNRLTCENKDAHWFNEANAKYYCGPCAHTFNDIAKRHGQPPLCELH